MAEILLAGVIAALLVDRFFLVRGHRQDLERSGVYDATVIDFAESVVDKHQQQVSEMATRIQHPQIPRPDLFPTEELPKPQEPDEYERVGEVDNGGPPEEPEDD